ncbi:MAG: beta-lactamase family protein [Gemmatimonadota bacterium]|nr:beta-lactamase family protein [Gemmatimonadota bacterium]
MAMRTQFLVLLAAGALASPLAEAQSPPATISEGELLARLAAKLDSLAALDHFSGVVALVKNGSPIFQRVYGMADRGSRRKNDLHTAFNLGSINKVFTGTAVRQLATAGKLDLDSTLARYWPDYPNPDVASRVTIRQLLEHRSGVGGDIFAAPRGGKRSDIRHNRDFLQLFVEEPLQFEPGTSRRYSNSGYIVLGELVERVSGIDYYEYIRRNVYEPAGMTRTAHFRPDSLPANTALGYTRGGRDAPQTAPLRSNTELLPGRGSAAGGGYSTVTDLLKFLSALRGGKIPGAPPPGIGVAGGAPGLNAVLVGGLPGGYDLVVLANLDPPAAVGIGEMVRRWLGGRS